MKNINFSGYNFFILSIISLVFVFTYAPIAFSQNNKLGYVDKIQSKECYECYKQGYVLEGKGDYSAAIDAYKKALQIEPQNDIVLYALGYTYFKKGERLNSYKYFLKVKGKKFQALSFLILIVIALIGLLSYFRKGIKMRGSTLNKWFIGTAIFFAVELFFSIRSANSRVRGFPDAAELMLFFITSSRFILLFFLFRLKNWARIAYFFMIFSMCFAASILPYLQAYERAYSAHFISAFIGITYVISFIYFFTRDKVKKLFK